MEIRLDPDEIRALMERNPEHLRIHGMGKRRIGFGPMMEEMAARAAPEPKMVAFTVLEYSEPETYTLAGVYESLEEAQEHFEFGIEQNSTWFEYRMCVVNHPVQRDSPIHSAGMSDEEIVDAVKGV